MRRPGALVTADAGTRRAFQGHRRHEVNITGCGWANPFRRVRHGRRQRLAFRFYRAHGWAVRYTLRMSETAPTTSELRAWAQEQGLAVASRGRLKPEILAAWRGAHRQPNGPQRRSGSPAPTKLPSAAPAPAPAKATRKPPAAEPGATLDKPGSDLTAQLADFQVQLAALVSRVEKLETAGVLPAAVANLTRLLGLRG